MSDVLAALRGGIIVSCQASPGDPTDSAAMMEAFARAAERGGAVGLRLNGPGHVWVAHLATPALPIIGIAKRPGPDGQVLITGDAADVLPLITAGAALVAFDAQDRARPSSLAALVEAIHAGGALALADLRCFVDAGRALDMGADVLATTLSVLDLPAYTPDIALIERLVRAFDVPVIAEGNFWQPEDVARAFDAGAHAVVIGSAITRPWLITERFVHATPGH